jgi:shikimate kinase
MARINGIGSKKDIQRNKMRLFLTGMMGSGKSAVGKALADRYGYTLIDLDEEIVKKYSKSIETIFKLDGENRFREYETDTARSLDLPDHAVIATGGGFPLKETNRRWMKTHGKIIWLKSSPAVILERIKDEDRPLLPKPITVDHIATILHKRIPVYQQADQVIETDDMTPNEIAEAIRKIYL